MFTPTANGVVRGRGKTVFHIGQINVHHAVTDIPVRLGGNGTQIGFGPGNHRADSEELALDRNTEIAGVRIESNNGKRGDNWIRGRFASTLIPSRPPDRLAPWQKSPSS